MAISYKNEIDFGKQVLSENGILERAIEFIKDNIAIQNVYDRTAIVDWVKENEAPGDVFSDNDLKDWAETNGYTHESEGV